MKRLVFMIVLLYFALVANAQEGDPRAPVTMSPEDLENYQFDNRQVEQAASVSELNVGQRFILDSHRRSIKDLMIRRLGIVSLKQDKSDIARFQQLVDRKIIRQNDVEEWQALGVVFGDVLVTELGLHWVSYQDDLGVSKALRWKKTENYVFPITIFSKRVQFKEKIDVQAIFEKIEKDVAAFKRYEEIHGKIGHTKR